MLLNKRELEKLKERWWKNDEVQSTCVKPEDQSDGISIQNIGGVFIVIFVGIAMACVTLIFEYWWYRYRKNPKVVDLQDSGNKNTTANAFLDKWDILSKRNKNTESFGKLDKPHHAHKQQQQSTTQPQQQALRTRFNQQQMPHQQSRIKF